MFNENQVTFICQKFVCNEADRLRLSLITDEDRWVMFKITDSGFSVLGVQKIWEVLSVYPERNLTFDSDVLDACRGILRTYSRYRIWGMPIEADATECFNIHWELVPTRTSKT